VIDFTIPDDVQETRARVAAFIDEQVLPAEAEVGTRPYFDIVARLQAKARSAGLWCPFIPAEWGGMGLGPLANAIVQIEVGRSKLAAWAMNCMGPQDATMLTLLEHGTQEQKEKFLVPLVNAERRICFSMTERAAGSDATGMRTTAVRDGDSWVLNGEKWFSSSASISDYVLIMARTDPDAPRHRQFTTFLAELPDPGYQIIRDIPTLHEAVEPRFGDEATGGHAEVRIKDLRIPHENVVGEVAAGSRWASTGSATAASGTACGASPRRSRRWTWPPPTPSSGRRSASRWPTGRASSGCSPTAPATCTSPG